MYNYFKNIFFSNLFLLKEGLILHMPRKFKNSTEAAMPFDPVYCSVRRRLAPPWKGPRGLLPGHVDPSHTVSSLTCLTKVNYRLSFSTEMFDHKSPVCRQLFTFIYRNCSYEIRFKFLTLTFSGMLNNCGPKN